MARAAAPMFKGLRGATRTTRKRSDSAFKDKGDEFTAGGKDEGKDVEQRKMEAGILRYAQNK